MFLFKTRALKVALFTSAAALILGQTKAETPNCMPAAIANRQSLPPEPVLDLRPFRWNSPTEAKIRYANQVFWWARSQSIPQYSAGKPPRDLTPVEKKLLDAMQVVSAVPDSKADSVAKAQAKDRVGIFESAYKESVKNLILLKPPSEMIKRELKRDLKLALEETRLADGTADAREVH